MTWLSLALLFYFLLALSSLIDRYLLAGPLPSPGAYAFLVGAGGGLGLLLAPFGFKISSSKALLLCLGTGSLWIIAIFFLYLAIKKSGVTRTVPAVAGLIPFFTFLFSRTKIEPGLLTPFLLLTSSSLILAWDKKPSLKKIGFFILPAVAFSLSFLGMEKAYNSTGFITGFVLMRIGGLIPAILLLSFKKIRKEVFYKKPLSKKKVTLPLVSGQILAGSAFMLQNYAVFLAEPKDIIIINALEGTRFVFLFAFVFFLSRVKPGLLKEKMEGKELLRKIVAVLLVCSGLISLAFLTP